MKSILLQDLKQCLLPLQFQQDKYPDVITDKWTPYATLGNNSGIYLYFIHEETNDLPNNKWIRRTKRMDFNQSTMIVLLDKQNFYKFKYPIMLDCRGDKNIISIKNHKEIKFREKKDNESNWDYYVAKLDCIFTNPKYINFLLRNKNE
ncbi:MAG: hypothetical protein ACRCTJ_06095 [Brevinema sp.]